MLRDQENHISYDKWSELTSKDIFLCEDEKPKFHSKLYDMYGDDFEDEEFSDSKSKKMNV